MVAALGAASVVVLLLPDDDDDDDDEEEEEEEEEEEDGRQARLLRSTALRLGLGELEEALVPAHDLADARDGRRTREAVWRLTHRVRHAQELGR